MNLCCVYNQPPLISGSYVAAFHAAATNNMFQGTGGGMRYLSLCTRWIVSSSLGSCRSWKQGLMDGSVTEQTRTSWKSLMPKAKEGTFLGRHIQTHTTMTSLTTSGRLREAMTASSCPGQWMGTSGDSPHACYMNAGYAWLFSICMYVTDISFHYSPEATS